MAMISPHPSPGLLFAVIMLGLVVGCVVVAVVVEVWRWLRRKLW